MWRPGSILPFGVCLFFAASLVGWAVYYTRPAVRADQGEVAGFESIDAGQRWLFARMWETKDQFAFEWAANASEWIVTSTPSAGGRWTLQLDQTTGPRIRVVYRTNPVLTGPQPVLAWRVEVTAKDAKDAAHFLDLWRRNLNNPEPFPLTRPAPSSRPAP